MYQVLYKASTDSFRASCSQFFNTMCDHPFTSTSVHLKLFPNSQMYLIPYSCLFHFSEILVLFPASKSLHSSRVKVQVKYHLLSAGCLCKTELFLPSVLLIGLPWHLPIALNGSVSVLFCVVVKSFVTFFLHFIKTHSRVLLFQTRVCETAGSPSPLSFRNRQTLSPTLDFMKYNHWGWSRNLCLHEISREFLCPEQRPVLT